MRKVDVASAMEYYYAQVAQDRSVQRKGPGKDSMAWAAYLNFLGKLSNEDGGDHRSYGLHVSSAGGNVGWECTRTYFYELVNQPTVSDYQAPMQKRFELGHASHWMVYKRIGHALQLYYKNELEIIDLEFEKRIPAQKGSLIVGTMDIWMVYRWRGESDSHVLVIDVKSTSANQQEKRTRGTLGNRRIELDPAYMRQLQIYMETVKADHGAVLFWTINYTIKFEFNQADVRTNPRVFSMVREKEDRAIAAIESGEEVPGTPGAWCSSCNYRAVCPSVAARKELS